MTTSARGRAFEERAARELVRRGYRIVARNYRCRVGEIDLIARDGDTLVFVEVRSRASGAHGSALATVDVRKQARIARVAEHYVAAEKPRFATCRFDVVGVTGGELIVVRDAFRPGLP